MEIVLKKEIDSYRSSFGPSFLNWEITDLTSSCSKLFEILLFLNCYTGLSVPKTRRFEKIGKKKLFDSPYLKNIDGPYSFTWNLKIIEWKTEIGACRSTFGASFLNWESIFCKSLYQINQGIEIYDFIQGWLWKKNSRSCCFG